MRALRQELEEAQSDVAEAATLTTAHAQEQIHQLIAEREAWIEEVTAQRAEATGALECVDNIGGRVVGFNRTSQAHRTGQQSGDSPAAHTSHALLAAALEASRALERQYAEVAEARQALSATLDEEKVGWEWGFLARRGGTEQRCAVAGMPTQVCGAYPVRL